MSFNVDDFKENGLSCGGARPTNFEVIFHGLGDADKECMKYLCHSVDTYITSHTELTFHFYEREDGFVADRVTKLDGPVTIIEYSKAGEVMRGTTYQFTVCEITNRMGWDMSNEIKQWKVAGLGK